MTLEWKGDQVKQRARKAAMAGINATMAACIIYAKSDHGPGARGSGRFETRTGNLERSIQIHEQARKVGGWIRGIWGSKDIVYARRIELGFQGKDSKGRVIDQIPLPFLRPAAKQEYPKLAGRIKRALEITRVKNA